MLHDGTFVGNEERELRTYALSLPNGPAGFEGILQPASIPVPVGTMGPLHVHPISGLFSCDWAAASPSAGIARVTLDLRTADPGAVSFRDRHHSMVLTFAAAPAGFDAYFLPWDGRGGVAWMTLPAALGGPNHFFTAALSGCSVMIAGAANNPTVFHCGVDDWNNSPHTKPPYNNAALPAATTPQLWEDLVQHVHGAAPAATVDKTHYVNDFAGAPQTTATSRATELALQGRHGDPNAEALPWGSVCGVRDAAGNWAFYLQENATMKWGLGAARRFFARHLPGRLRIATERSMCRPMAVNRFFNVPAMLPRLWNL